MGVFDNFLEKEKRKLNVVMHNIPESDGGNYTERMEMDKGKFQEVIKDGLRLNARVTKAYRVVKPGHEKPRLLIVGLENAEVKADILKLAPQLRMSDRWRGVFISPDLTWKEREEGRKLREELRRRTNSGEEDLVIRRGRIVRRETQDHQEGQRAEETVTVRSRPQATLPQQQQQSISERQIPGGPHPQENGSRHQQEQN